LLDIWPLPRFDQKKNIARIIIEKIPFFIIAGLFSFIAYKAQSSAGAVVTIQNLPLSFRIMNAFHSIIFYLENTFIPIRVVPFHPAVNAVSSFKKLYALIAVIVISVLCFIYGRKKRTGVSIAWFFYIITLLPVLGLTQIGNQSAADRYTYLPTISILLLITTYLVSIQVKLDKKHKITSYKPIFLIFIPIFIIFSLLTIKQIGVWKDSVSLWEYCAKRYPDTSRTIYLNLGTAYNNAGKYKKAIKAYKKSIKISPDHVKAFSNLGYAYSRIGEHQKAIEQYRMAIEIDPRFVNTYVNFGNTYYHMGRYDDAIAMFEKAIKLKPDYVEAYNNLGNAYSFKNEYQKAIDAYKKAIEIYPYSESAYTNIGNVYNRIGKKQEAIELYSEAIKMNPNLTQAHYNLGCLYYDSGRYSDAIIVFKKTIKINPKHSRAYEGLAIMHYNTKEYDLALKYYKRAIQLGVQPDQRLLNALESLNQ